MSSNPFIEKVSRFVDLDDVHETRLEHLKGESFTYAAGDTVYLDSSEQCAFFVVESGWFYAYAVLPDGCMQVHDIYHPGDIVGLDHLTWGMATSSVAAASDGTLVCIDASRARRMMFRHPQISAVFYSMHMLTNVLLLDRLTAVARLSAYNSLAYFLCDAYLRRRAAEPDTDSPEGYLILPLTQDFIADCLGLSPVHVSRQFKKMQENGLIERIDRKTIQIMDIGRLMRISDYLDRYENLDRMDLPQTATRRVKSRRVA